MSNSIGDVRGVTGTSVSLNCQKGDGAQKPMPKEAGEHYGTKPPKAPEGPVPMPK